MKKIFIIAGEASGDYLGGKLMQDIRSLLDDVEFIGVGGPRMEKAGLQSLFSIKELSIIGVFEAIGKIFHVKRLIDKTVEAVFHHMPDVVVTIDSSGFTHRVDKAIKKRLPTTPIVHYVAPPVWAWRGWRAKTMHKFIDKLMVLLPFEPDLFNKYNLETVFVGHPIAVDEDLDEPSRNDKDAFLRKIGVRRAPKRYDCEDRIAVSICADLECNDAAQRQQREEPPQNFIVITLLPGSRPSEIDNHLPILAQFADMMVDRYENVRFIIPTIESLEKIIEEKTGDWRQKPLITTDKFQKTLAFYVSDIAIAASGTVVLELARAGLPFVVIYKTSTITAAIVKYLIQIKYVCLVNILANEPIVPELLQKNCTPQNIFDHAIRLLDIDNANAQKKSFAKIMGTLKVNHPKSAANEIIKMLT